MSDSKPTPIHPTVNVHTPRASGVAAAYLILVVLPVMIPINVALWRLAFWIGS